MNKGNRSAILILIATATVTTIFIWWVYRNIDTVEEAQQETLAVEIVFITHEILFFPRCLALFSKSWFITKQKSNNAYHLKFL